MKGDTMTYKKAKKSGKNKNLPHNKHLNNISKDTKKSDTIQVQYARCKKR